MTRMIAPSLVVLLVGMAAASFNQETKFIVDPITYPDGTNGVAVVVVTVKNAPVVVVDYYTEDSVKYLGRYTDSSGGEVPTASDEAREFAFNHYFDKW